MAEHGGRDSVALTLSFMIACLDYAKNLPAVGLEIWKQDAF